MRGALAKILLLDVGPENVATTVGTAVPGHPMAQRTPTIRLAHRTPPRPSTSVSDPDGGPSGGYLSSLALRAYVLPSPCTLANPFGPAGLLAQRAYRARPGRTGGRVIHLPLRYVYGQPC